MSTSTKDPCSGCYYRRSCGTEHSCDYIFLAGCRRPCPPGEGCTVKLNQKKERGFTIVKKAQWDTKQGRQLYLAGNTDQQIADQVGASKIAVHNYRLAHWPPALPPEAAASDAASMTEAAIITTADSAAIVRAAKPADVSPKHDAYDPAFMDVLAAATAELRGIDVVCTANAILHLFHWRREKGSEDLREASRYIDYLLENLG